MNRCIGLDLGSRRSKAVVLEAGLVVEKAIFDAWSLAHGQIEEWVQQRQPAAIGATGYSRQLARKLFNARVQTEIAAFAAGAGLLAPGALTLFDIGGQDAKIIRLDGDGTALDFEMNDKCAAGTGKFFELLAGTLGLRYSEMLTLADATTEAVSITSTCAVFAESEIISRLADGVDRGQLARGAMRSVAERLAAMGARVGCVSPLILVGGGANNALAAELSACLRSEILLPADGAFFGAVGIARLVSGEFTSRGNP